jgi:hypothetical protein
MSRPYLALAALSLGLLPTSPATAGPRGGGSPCEMVLQRSGSTATGTVWAGPWTSAEISGDAGLGDDITVRCSIQYGDAPGNTDLTSVSTTGTGAVVLGPDAVSFTVSPSATLYLCTEVFDTHDGTTDAYEYDADGDATNGVQCVEAASVPNAAGDLVTVLFPRAIICVGIDEPFSPYGVLACVMCGRDCPPV